MPRPMDWRRSLAEDGFVLSTVAAQTILPPAAASQTVTCSRSV